MNARLASSALVETLSPHLYVQQAMPVPQGQLHLQLVRWELSRLLVDKPLAMHALLGAPVELLPQHLLNVPKGLLVLAALSRGAKLRALSAPLVPPQALHQPQHALFARVARTVLM